MTNEQDYASLLSERNELKRIVEDCKKGFTGASLLYSELSSERDELKEKLDEQFLLLQKTLNDKLDLHTRSTRAESENAELKKEVERLKAQVEGFKEHIAHDARNLHLDPSQYYRD